jgi:hypothetical protein
MLMQVEFVTWLPAEQRLSAQGGNIAPDAKIEMGVMIWAPWPVDDYNRYAPDKMPAGEQGMLWAQNEVIRMRPDGREVLSIIGVKMMGVVEGLIVNQPRDVKSIRVTLDGQDAGAADMGLRLGNLVAVDEGK